MSKNTSPQRFSGRMVRAGKPCSILLPVFSCWTPCSWMNSGHARVRGGCCFTSCGCANLCVLAGLDFYYLWKPYVSWELFAIVLICLTYQMSKTVTSSWSHKRNCSSCAKLAQETWGQQSRKLKYGNIYSTYVTRKITCFLTCTKSRFVIWKNLQLVIAHMSFLCYSPQWCGITLCLFSQASLRSFTGRAHFGIAKWLADYFRNSMHTYC